MAQQATSAQAPAVRLNRMTAFVQSLFFVAGFATFVVGFLGLASTALGDLFFDARQAITIVGGLVLIVFGLFTLRIINIPFLYSDTRRQINPAATRGASGLQSYLTGLAFAAGWTPCIGPFLGAILTLSVSAELATRLALLTAYTLGLGIPFILVALLADRMTPLIARLKRHMRTIELASGILLILIGVLLVSGQLLEVTRILGASTFNPEEAILGEGFAAGPTLLIALAAGFLSFASPCVLPLIPAYIAYISGWTVNAVSRGATPAESPAGRPQN